ncbi:MAG: copper chaperone PCu(A)C [Alphaproteobacteria bacterium]|nr:copper chaperone PCu(A)C [Alphaproteobacteria bacterium]
MAKLLNQFRKNWPIPHTSRINKVMKKLLLTLTLFVLYGTAHAHIIVQDGWARATTPSQKVSAAYVILTNHSPDDLKIVAAHSPIAERTELHTHTMDEHGRMEMTHVDSIPFPSMEMVQFKPGGWHVMMININRTLVVGHDVPVTLTFDDGSSKTFRAVVKPLSYRPE